MMFTKLSQAQTDQAEKFVDLLLHEHSIGWLDWYIKKLTERWWRANLLNFFRLKPTLKHEAIKEIGKEHKKLWVIENEKLLVTNMAKNKNSFIQEHSIWKLDAKEVKYQLLKNYQLEDWNKIAIIWIPYSKKDPWDYTMSTKFWRTMEISRRSALNIYKDATTTYKKRVDEF